MRRHDAHGHVVYELPGHVTMRAQDDVIELRVAHELEGAAHPTALGQRGRLLNLQATIPRERLHRLHAPEIWARVDRGDLERLEDVDERLGLLHTLLAEGADTVVAFPVAPAAALGLAYEIEKPQAGAGSSGVLGIHLRMGLRSRACQPFIHSSRALWAAMSSAAISWPATHARHPVTPPAHSPPSQA